MAIEHLLARFGLPAIFLGAGIEGETLVIAGGVLARRDLVPLWAAVLAAALGSSVADQLFFAAGRHFRDNRRVHAITQKPAFARALASLERHPTGFILGFRFLYGLRTISPIAVGTSHIPVMRFVLLNAIAALLWAMLFAGLGYVFGHGIERLFARLWSSGHPVLIGGAIVIAVVAIVRLLGRWHHRSG